MIYQPRLVLDLRVALASGIFRAVTLAISDFIAGDNQGWAYYLGAALGYTAAATGIPYATATMFVTCEALDAVFFHSPDGSDVDIYVDGLLTATIDTFEESGTSWEAFGGIILDGLRHRVDFVNSPSTNGDKTSTINWFGIGAITATGGAQIIERGTPMAVYTLSIPSTDAQSTKPKSFTCYLPSGMTLANIQLLASAICTPLDAVLAGVLSRPEVLIQLDLPGSLKAAAVAGVNNRRGLLLSLLTSGQPTSIWTPGVRETVAPIDGDVDIAQAQVDALLDVLLAADIGGSGEGLVTRYGETMSSARSASVTFRK